MRFNPDKLETNFIEPVNLYGPIKERMSIDLCK